jgi:hypothetical protein
MSELIPEWDALNIPENENAEPADAQPEHIPADDNDSND